MSISRHSKLNDDDGLKSQPKTLKMKQVVETPPPGIDFSSCEEEEEGLCCLGYVSSWE